MNPKQKFATLFIVQCFALTLPVLAFGQSYYPDGHVTLSKLLFKELEKGSIISLDRSDSFIIRGKCSSNISGQFVSCKLCFDGGRASDAPLMATAKDALISHVVTDYNETVHIVFSSTSGRALRLFCNSNLGYGANLPLSVALKELNEAGIRIKAKKIQEVGLHFVDQLSSRESAR